MHIVHSKLQNRLSSNDEFQCKKKSVYTQKFRVQTLFSKQRMQCITLSKNFLSLHKQCLLNTVINIFKYINLN